MNNGKTTRELWLLTGRVESDFLGKSYILAMIKMNKMKLLFTFFLFLSVGYLKAQPTPAAESVLSGTQEDSLSVLVDQIRDADWQISKVAKGVEWRSFHFEDLYSAKQFITVIEVDMRKKITIDLPYVTKGFMKTSEAADSAKALAAINGSFFDTKVGGSTVFLRRDGEVITETREKFTPYRESAGFSVDKRGNVSIIKRPGAEDGGWESVQTHTLLASGPLLVYDGQLIEQQNAPFNTNRHPRTAVGVTADNRVICVVVDGRSSESYGMSIPELAQVMYALGCVGAMNLDGGGSSTAWVKGHGVVNHPTDNKQFDHEGERSVANAILFKSK